MILDLDVGNTRLKWRLTTAAGERADGGANLLSDDTIFNGIPLEQVTRVRVSNVAGADVEEQIRDLCQAQSDCDPEFARSLTEVAGVRNGYLEPDRLGVDRWLAILAAWEMLESPCCVVDCGSAMTLDFVDASGQHLGGLITPGLTMMQESLLRDTREIRLQPGDLAWIKERLGGRSTGEAVFGGIIGMTSELVNSAVRRFTDSVDGSVTLILTGGGATLLSDYLQSPSQTIPELVLDGLRVALP